MDHYKKALSDGCRPYRSKGSGQSALMRASETLSNDKAEPLSFNASRSRLRDYLAGLEPDEWAALHGEGKAKVTGNGGLTFQPIPNSDLPVDTLIEHLTARFRKEKEHKDARQWRRVRINKPGPFAVAFIGDPHVDNHGCNWPLLRRDVEIIKSTPHLYAANAGDTIDNWTGRLAKLKGKNAVTDSDAWRLAKWLIDELADEWIMFVLGNHDTWGEGGAIFRAINNVIECDDWEAKVILEAANGAEFPIWLAHSFKGTSIYNPVHGAMRKAKFSGAACLYVQGHHHEWAIHTEEDAEKGLVYTAAKARGYKFNDEYATVNGFEEQQEGATVVAVFDPDAESACAAVQCFPDLPTAADYLNYKRAKYDGKFSG